MKVWMTVLIQVLGFALTLLTLLTNVVPVTAKPYLVLVASAIQGFIAWYAHQFNPDGTPATVAYVKH